MKGAVSKSFLECEAVVVDKCELVVELMLNLPNLSYGLVLLLDLLLLLGLGALGL